MGMRETIENYPHHIKLACMYSPTLALCLNPFAGTFSKERPGTLPFLTNRIIASQGSSFRGDNRGVADWLLAHVTWQDAIASVHQGTRSLILDSPTTRNQRSEAIY